MQNAAQAIPTIANLTKLLFMAHLYFLFYWFDGETISPLHQSKAATAFISDKPFGKKFQPSFRKAATTTFAMASPRIGGTALPICRFFDCLPPTNL